MSNDPPRILVMGTSWLGAEVLSRLHARGYAAALITTRTDDRAAVRAFELGLPFAAKPDPVPLMAMDFPWRPDLIVCAHSFRILPLWVLQFARLGAIGYHPSLLPAFKGRRAIEDTLAAGRRITGGSVYWLTGSIDGGPVVAAGGVRFQRQVQVLPGESAAELWRRALAPLGAELLEEAVRAVAVTAAMPFSPT
jgi:methionyl-tRNA formyltransferase